MCAFGFFCCILRGVSFTFLLIWAWQWQRKPPGAFRICAEQTGHKYVNTNVKGCFLQHAAAQFVISAVKIKNAKKLNKLQHLADFYNLLMGGTAQKRVW